MEAGKELASSKRADRLEALKKEFLSLLLFHSESFKEIEAKARYWLTISLPSFLALVTVLLERHQELNSMLLSVGTSLAFCLFVVSFSFSRVLLSQRIESGILVPPQRKFEELDAYLTSDERWAKLCDQQIGELLRAISVIEAANAAKSKNLGFAELSLFRAVPTSILIAGACTLIDPAASPILASAPVEASVGLSPPARSAGIGVGAAAGAIIIFCGIRHVLSKKSD